jgi:hypothetical protein
MPGALRSGAYFRLEMFGAIALSGRQTGLEFREKWVVVKQVGDEPQTGRAIDALLGGVILHGRWSPGDGDKRLGAKPITEALSRRLVFLGLEFLMERGTHESRP